MEVRLQQRRDSKKRCAQEAKVNQSLSHIGVSPQEVNVGDKGTSRRLWRNKLGRITLRGSNVISSSLQLTTVYFKLHHVNFLLMNDFLHNQWPCLDEYFVGCGYSNILFILFWEKRKQHRSSHQDTLKIFLEFEKAAKSRCFTQNIKFWGLHNYKSFGEKKGQPDLLGSLLYIYYCFWICINCRKDNCV